MNFSQFVMVHINEGHLRIRIVHDSTHSKMCNPFLPLCSLYFHSIVSFEVLELLTWKCLFLFLFPVLLGSFPRTVIFNILTYLNKII